MALADVLATWTPETSGNGNEQDIYMDTENPAQELRESGASMTTDELELFGVGEAGQTWYGRIVTRNTDVTPNLESEYTWEIGTVLGPEVAWASPANGASLTAGNSVSLAADVTPNAHPGAGQPGGHAGVRFEYSTNGGTTYTPITTVACDDTSTPQAQHDWTAVAGANRLRAVNVDGSDNELGAAAEITITSAAAVSFVNDYDFSSPTSGNLIDDGTDPADLSYDGTFTQGNDSGGDYWGTTGGDSGALYTNSPTMDQLQGRLEADFWYTSNSNALSTLILLYDGNVNTQAMQISIQTGIQRVDVKFWDSGGTKAEWRTSNGVLGRGTGAINTLILEWSWADDEIILTTNGTERLNVSMSGQMSNPPRSFDTMSVWGENAISVENGFEGQLYRLQIAD